MHNSPQSPASPKQSSPGPFSIQRQFDGSQPCLDMLRRLIAAHCG